jgi:uncharacterized protein YnzC (UPF0291/DUF896 family)
MRGVMYNKFMLEQKKIDRINELARKSRKEGLSHEEKREQYELRQEYLSSFRKSFRVQLENIEVVDTPQEAERLRRKYALQGASPNGRDVTSEN